MQDLTPCGLQTIMPLHDPMRDRCSESNTLVSDVNEIEDFRNRQPTSLSPTIRSALKPFHVQVFQAGSTIHLTILDFAMRIVTSSDLFVLVAATCKRHRSASWRSGGSDSRLSGMQEAMQI